jgi:hypothetical protein
MTSGLEQVRAVIGDEDVSGLPDQILKDSLWDCYFDVQKTVQWAVGWFSQSNNVGHKLSILLQRNKRGDTWRNNAKVSFSLVSF